MALVIHLKKDQQIVLNGAVIENTSGRSISLSVKNWWCMRVWRV